MSALTHFDAQGQAHMVDVAAKAATHRIAVAGGRIEMLPATLALIEAGNAKKGDVLGIARIAGIQAAKKTSDLIPLCHPLALTRVAIEFEAASARPASARGIFCLKPWLGLCGLRAPGVGGTAGGTVGATTADKAGPVIPLRQAGQARAVQTRGQVAAGPVGGCGRCGITV